ncbi:MAG: hypothetical protein ACRDA8_08805, partial [Shewanella sp.]
MTATPTQPWQIKRDIAQLINLYPASAPKSALYLQALNAYWGRTEYLETHEAKGLSAPALKVLGQIGLGDGLELLACLYQHQQSTEQQERLQQQLNLAKAKIHCPRRRLLIKVFEPHPLNTDELNALWDQSPSLLAAPQLRPLADAILAAAPANITGCQRLLLDDGKLMVDLHFGEIGEQLSLQPHSPAHKVQQWLVLPHMHSQLSHRPLWQMARLSADDAWVLGINLPPCAAKALVACGFGLQNLNSVSSVSCPSAAPAAGSA